MKTKCERGIHKFEARYSEVQRNGNINLTGHISPDLAKELTTLYVYEYDICVKCGKIVNKARKV